MLLLLTQIAFGACVIVALRYLHRRLIRPATFSAPAERLRNVEAQDGDLRAELASLVVFNAIRALCARTGTIREAESVALEGVARLLDLGIMSRRTQTSTLREELQVVREFIATANDTSLAEIEVRAGVPRELLEERVPSWSLVAMTQALLASVNGSRSRVTLDMEARSDIAERVIAVHARDASGTLRVSGDGDCAVLGCLRERVSLQYGAAASLEVRAEPEGAGLVFRTRVGERSGSAA